MKELNMAKQLKKNDYLDRKISEQLHFLALEMKISPGQAEAYWMKVIDASNNTPPHWELKTRSQMKAYKAYKAMSKGELKLVVIPTYTVKELGTMVFNLLYNINKSWEKNESDTG